MNRLVIKRSHLRPPCYFSSIQIEPSLTVQIIVSVVQPDGTFISVTVTIQLNFLDRTKRRSSCATCGHVESLDRRFSRTWNRFRYVSPAVKDNLRRRGQLNIDALAQMLFGNTLSA